MRTILFFLLLLFSANCYSQVTKTDKIAEKSGVYLRVGIKYDNDMNIINKTVVFMGQNREYTSIIDIVNVVSGDAQYVYDFLNQIKQFVTKFKNDDSVSIKIYDRNVSRMKVAWVKGVSIDAERGYITLGDSQIDFFIKKTS